MIALNWQALSKSEVLSARNDSGAWERLYDGIDSKLQLAARYLHHQLHVFSVISGKGRVAHFSLRIKERPSFVTKMMKLANDTTNLDRKFEELGLVTRSRAITVFDLVNDLIGARLVFYFERDILEALVFFMGFPLFHTVEVTQWRQDMSGYDSALPATRWLSELPMDSELQKLRQRQPKESGYESLHLILAFNKDAIHARARIAKAKAAKHPGAPRPKAGLCDVEAPPPDEVDEQRNDLARMRFEVQCRTSVEDVWAEVEHRARYAAAKSGRDGTIEKGSPTRVFRDYKAILRAAQVFQNSIRSGFRRWDETDVSLLGRQTNIDIGARSVGWSSAEQQYLEDVNVALRTALLASRTGDDSSSKLWNEALDTLTKALAQLAPDGSEPAELLRVSAERMSAEEYDKRRIIVMLLAFIAAYADDPSDPKRSAECAEVRAKAATAFYDQNVAEHEYRIWMPTRMAPIRIYEHLSMLDEYHEITGATALVCSADPLVTARAASAYFRHFGSLQRSLSLLKDAQARIEVWRDSKREPTLPEVLQPCYIGKRLAETYWASYHLDGRRPQDLEAALAAAEEAIEYVGKPQPDFEMSLELQQKLWAHIITFQVTKVMKEIGKPGDNGWAIFREVGQRLLPRWNLITQALIVTMGTDEIQNASLRRQGCALACACLAEGGVTFPGEMTPHDWLNEARLHVRGARRNIEAKANRGLGWALPMHAEVTREMQDLVFSLCLKDLTSP